MRKVGAIVAASLGNFIEYYDYALYGFLAIPLAETFFPNHVFSHPLVAVFSVFALGKISKPLGAFFFSRWGDAKGRKGPLHFSMFGMGIIALSIALLPGYDVLGLTASLLLLGLRLMQGFFLGGETDGARIYLMEYMGKKRFGIANGLIGVTSILGIYAASLALGAITENNYSWRWFFLIGSAGAFVIFLLRIFLPEIPFFHRRQKHDHTLSLLPTLKKNKMLFILVIFMAGMTGAMYHYLSFFFPLYMQKFLPHFAQKHITTAVQNGILTYAIFTLIGGVLTDTVGQKKYLVVLKAIVFGLVLLFVGLLYVQIFSSFLYILLWGAFSLSTAPIFSYIVGALKPTSRYRILAIGHAIGSLSLSGTAPGIAAYLMGGAHPYLAWVYFLLLSAGLLFCSVRLVQKIEQQNA